MKRSVSARVSKWAQIIFIWAIAVVFFAPLCLAVTNSFKPRSEIMASALSLPTSLYLDNYRTVMEDDYFLSSFITSVLMVAATTSNGLTLVIMSTLFVPFQVYMVALIVIVRQIGLTGNLIGLLLVYIALGMPVPIFLVRSYATGMSLEIEEAATIDGCGRLRMLGAIVLPLMKPVLATVAVLNALWVWGEFLVAFLVYGTKKPMTLPVSQQYFYGTYSNQWNLILAGFVISTIPIVIFYLVMQRHIVKGIAAGAVKG